MVSGVDVYLNRDVARLGPSGVRHCTLVGVATPRVQDARTVTRTVTEVQDGTREYDSRRKRFRTTCSRA